MQAHNLSGLGPRLCIEAKVRKIGGEQSSPLVWIPHTPDGCDHSFRLT
jgi:hypothetical protein